MQKQTNVAFIVFNPAVLKYEEILRLFDLYDCFDLNYNNNQE